MAGIDTFFLLQSVEQSDMPLFSDATYDGETVRLRNDGIRLDVHRKPIGWGWGELFAPSADGDDRYLGVLEHLGEVNLERFPHPLQLVADEVEESRDGDSNRLTFDLRVQELPDLEDFRDEAEYDAYPEVTGSLVLTLASDGEITYDLTVEANDDLELTRLRGPWFRVGADGFGADRDDAIFPGIDWVTGDEWSSSNEYVEHPNALRVAPHPNKVTIPTMTVSNAGDGVGLSWDVGEVGSELGRPQPIFASPNFVDRRNDTLLGLMLPGADGALPENELECEEAVSLSAGDTVGFNAKLTVTEGTSLDVVTDWVRRNGFPEPPEPRYDWEEFLEWVAECYDTNLWIDGEGFGADIGFMDGGSPDVPSFVERYLEYDDADDDLVASLEEKVAWCREQGTDEELSFDLGRALETAVGLESDEVEEFADQLLEIRREDGAFTYDPENRHDNFRLEWLDYSRPLGQPGEIELGFCVEGGGALILAGRTTGDRTYIEAGLETLEFAMQFEKPAGDDWWETPIHGPNLFAGGKAAIAYELAYEETGDEHYRDRARYWLRSLIPFTHLWEHDEMEMLYNTKPCLVASIWTVVSWVNNHVIWEVLSVFETMDELHMDWTELDPELDWDRYHEGITTAVMRWMIDSRVAGDYLDRFEFPDERMRDGEFDSLYADIHDPLDGTYAGGPITPDHVANNVLALLRRK